MARYQEYYDTRYLADDIDRTRQDITTTRLALHDAYGQERDDLEAELDELQSDLDQLLTRQDEDAERYALTLLDWIHADLDEQIAADELMMWQEEL